MEWRTREFVSIKDACAALCESVRTFWRRVAAQEYPRPYKNGNRGLVAVDWLRSEVDRRKAGG
jgi:predicted DNA-binding transcriptional regulator AlpA